MHLHNQSLLINHDTFQHAQHGDPLGLDIPQQFNTFDFQSFNKLYKLCKIFSFGEKSLSFLLIVVLTVHLILKDQAITPYNKFGPRKLCCPRILKDPSLVIRPFRFLKKKVLCTRVARLINK
jgi:hypothetical protein